MSEQAPTPDQRSGSAATPDDGDTDILDDLRRELAAELDEERPPAGGPAYQIVAALVVVALGLTGSVMSWNFGLGSLTKPGPGLWPFAVSVVITVLGVGLLVWGRQLTDTEKFTRSSLLILVAAATFIGMAVLLPVIGFEIPSLLLCVVWLRWLGGESWRSTVVVSLGVVASFYVVFILLLGVPIPRLI